MGILETLKTKLAPAREKVSDLAQQHEDKIDRGLDKAAKMVDDRTKGKYSEKIHTRTDKAKDALDRFAHRGEAGPKGAETDRSAEGDRGATPPPPPQDSPPPPTS
ncbi:antitoxin [Streptomyces himalayensis]|uniref:Antitoxin n=1 Tax=Streptomyces himalayensis subsp. himalayensis TaxID=2756131 RepID=A0A7W0DT42_9ACTN|nr:antitoxin [Streptomyces himalayensis]MBA2950759.1 antitoxin [Streptomyces himalayensis subsp. himalayensis]